MNLLIFLDLTYNPGKNFKFYSLQGQTFTIFLIFTYNQGKVFLILPITRGGTCIPGLLWELPPPPLADPESDPAVKINRSQSSEDTTFYENLI